MSSNDNLIQHVELTKDRLQQNLHMMRKGNTCLKLCAEFLEMDNRVFRAKLFASRFKVDGWADLTSEQKLMVEEAVPFIRAVKGIECEILGHNVNALHQFARKWSNRVKSGVAGYDDFFQEAAVAMTEAIYGYTRSDIAFITFAFIAIHHRLQTVSQQAHDLSMLSSEANVLMQMFAQAKQELNGPVNDEEVMAYLGLSESEHKALLDARRRSCQCSAMRLPGDQPEQRDYTQYRVDFDENRDEVVEEAERNETVFKVQEAIQGAKLTSVEKIVLEHFMSEGRGWQTALAKRVTNPATGKPYTKAGISIILQAAQKKVGRAFSHRAVA